MSHSCSLFRRILTLRLAPWVLALTVVAAANLRAEVTPRLEYQVKAGYLFNFLRFTEWPADTLPPGAPYRIGVIEDAATARIIADSLQDKKVNDRAIEVVSLAAGQPTKGCHLVFVPRSTAFALTEIPPPPILTVGETEHYASTQGIIGFIFRGYNIRFQVNLTAAQQAGLKLSGRLASLAEVVHPGAP
jgi:hypothetical protein